MSENKVIDINRNLNNRNVNNKNDTNNKSSKNGRNKKKKKKLMRLIIPAYLLILGILIMIVYAYPKLTGVLSKTMTIEYGNLQITDQVTCYIVKDETVYFADQTGNVEYYYDEGDMVRRGTEIVSVTSSDAGDKTDYSGYNRKVKSLLTGDTLLSALPGLEDAEEELRTLYEESEDEAEKSIFDFYIHKLADLKSEEDKEGGILPDFGGSEEVQISQIGVNGTYVANRSSVISYQLDGYETEFNPHTMRLLDKEKVNDIDVEVLNVKDGTTTRGEPVFKTIDNHKWYGVIWTDATDIDKYEKDKLVTLRLPKREVEGTVEDIIDNGDNVQVIMVFDTYYDDLATLRKIDTEVVTSDYKGLMVENSYIVTEDGVPGVYVMDVTGETEFVPVKVKTTDGTYSLVESGYFMETADGESRRVETVKVYDEIKKVD